MAQHRQTTEPAVKDGITQGELWDLLEGFFTRTLGEGDHNNIIEQALEFADFNDDGSVGNKLIEIYLNFPTLESHAVITLKFKQRNLP